jgi:AcrR family transcriptional regulator
MYQVPSVIMASRQSTADMHSALLDAARDLIGEIGYSEMSHADITATVGIGRTTFYEHFSSKEDVLVELVRRDLPPMADEIIAAVDVKLPPKERLAALARGMVRYVGTDHIGLVLHTEVPHLSQESQKSISEAHRGLTSEFAGVYSEGLMSGVFREMPPRFAGRMMEQIIMTGGKAVMESGNPVAEVDAIADDTAEVLVAAFSTRNG